MKKYVYFFGRGKAEGKAEMKGLLGGKGANLAEMTNIGLPVPAGFSISTEVCTHFYANKKTYPRSLNAEVAAALKKVESAMGAKFGDPKNPLLVSVRSGARASMPGMMDTIPEPGPERQDGRGARRPRQEDGEPPVRRGTAIGASSQMYGDVVLDLKPVDKKERDPVRGDPRREEEAPVQGVHLDTDLTVEALKEMVGRVQEAAIKAKTGKTFPEDPQEAAVGRRRSGVRLLDATTGRSSIAS
jgi:pyruvate,orthophosphate dikinase